MSRYINQQLLIKNKKRYLTLSKYPEIPLSEEDLYMYTNEGDRLDILANNYYKDSKLWWVLSVANPNLPKDSYFIPPGTQLRVPQDINSILVSYKKLNKI